VDNLQGPLQRGHKPDRPSAVAMGWVEAVVKPEEDGGYVSQHFNVCSCWEGPRMKGQGFKPDLGNPAVRHYRGGRGKRKPGWECEPVLQSKQQETESPT
jgi:hypothetical protein